MSKKNHETLNWVRNIWKCHISFHIIDPYSLYSVHKCKFCVCVCKYACLSVHMPSVCFSMISYNGFNPLSKFQKVSLKGSFWPYGFLELFVLLTLVLMWKWLRFDWILQWKNEQINSHMTVCVCFCTWGPVVPSPGGPLFPGIPCIPCGPGKP